MTTQREILKRLQETELEILQVIADFCKQNDIEWFLDSGTALGAVRHSGFIPWDDDIDVGMMRDQYDRFIELAANGLPEGYTLHTFGETKGFAPMFAKVCKDGTRFVTQETIESGYDQGFFVDVFPYDALSSDEGRAHRQLANARRNRVMSYLYHFKTQMVPHGGILGKAERLACRMAHVVLKVVASPERIKSDFDKSILNADEPRSQKCVCLSSHLMKVYDVDTLIPPVEGSFEGRSFPIPHDVRRYLEGTYGDWQCLPAEEDRHTHLPMMLDFGNGAVWSKSGALSEDLSQRA